MTQYTPLTQTALLKWVNTFETRRKAVSLQDLRDGIVLGQILEQMLAPEFHSSSLIQNPTSEDENKQNLETVYRGLARFLRTDNPLLAPSPSEFRAIAENPDDNAICEFLSAFLTAACLGSLSRTYVPKVMALDKPTQGEIAKIINHKSQLKSDREETAQDNPEAEEVDLDIHAIRDPALMAEELDQMKDKVDMLKKQNADLQSRLDKLLDTREAMLQDLKLAQDELTHMKRVRGSDATAAIRDLRNEIREKMAEIDRLEDLLEKETFRSSRLEKENESLRAKAERLKDLEDKVTVLEHETKQQQQTIKGLENYKKKAQDLTAIQQRNRVLDEQILQLEQDLRNYDEVKAQNRKLQKEIEEKVRVLTSNEQEIIYTLQSKNVLQDANEELKRRVEYLESRRQLDESTIRELQDQLQLGDIPQQGSDSPDATTTKFTLEQELETTGDPAVALRLELQRLKAENSLLRNNMTVASENERLRNELDSAGQKVDHFRFKCTEAMEKHAVAQEQINALINNATGEGESAFINMRRNLIEATKELEKLRKRAQDLEREAADRERELLQVKTDLDAIGQDQTAALAALKSSDELISESLRTELEATRKQLTQKAFESDRMKDQLMDALVSKDKIQKKLDDALAAATPATNSRQEEAPKGKKEDAEKIEKLKTALRQKMEQLEKSEQEKQDLQRRLKLAESGGAFAAQKAATDQIIRNLQRENAMMTTAWYDLTSRLQSNHVVLQRRHDAPRSWLNKQRQMVNATPRR
ncbi:HOOK N-terminal domain-containing protein [Madurella fahalii]|uniref:HOOK N-terminal domain-containing protein n=1 Tax=Madurella fahalii TaxID=1157608 RepID=A0ABQ0G6H8_9PEZI